LTADIQTEPDCPAEVVLTSADASRALLVRFPFAHDVVSWAIVNGGRRRAQAVVWREVRPQDLPVGGDPRLLLTRALQATGLEDAVGLLTARDLRTFQSAFVVADDCAVRCIATVGMGNGVAVGEPVTASSMSLKRTVGTINLLCQLSVAVSEEALIEALAIATEAKTSAVLDAALPSPASGRPITGTGTDCVVIAAPPRRNDRQRIYAGKHTTLGYAIGAAVREAVRKGIGEQAGQSQEDGGTWISHP